jgi:hypothetical protein
MNTKSKFIVSGSGCIALALCLFYLDSQGQFDSSNWVFAATAFLVGGVVAMSIGLATKSQS